MNPLATIHIAKRELGLDDDTYRDFLERETGKRSAKHLTHGERLKVVSAMERAGFKKSSKGARIGLEGDYARLLQALWIDAWNLGLVRDRRDKALLAFVKRQTGIDHTKWVRSAKDATKAVEALKSWIAREADVDWNVADQRFGKAIAFAQFKRLRPHVEDAQKAFAMEIAIMTGVDPSEVSDAVWIDVMNRLGRKLREKPADAA
ncbi:MAG: regulatory protein GemA [Pseudomonadota bacterium]